jgi:hypothetical protein
LRIWVPKNIPQALEQRVIGISTLKISYPVMGTALTAEPAIVRPPTGITRQILPGLVDVPNI